MLPGPRDLSKHSRRMDRLLEKDETQIRQNPGRFSSSTRDLQAKE